MHPRMETMAFEGKSIDMIKSFMEKRQPKIQAGVAQSHDIRSILSAGQD